jgi:hypothetical protein
MPSRVRAGLLAIAIALACGCVLPVPHRSAAANVSLSAAAGPVSSTITIRGREFDANRPVVIYVDRRKLHSVAPANLNTKGSRTDPNGTFSIAIVVPQAAYGHHDICADSGSVVGCAAFRINQSVSISVTSGLVGSRFDLTGTGFPAGEVVAIYADMPGQYFGTPGVESDALGSFQFRINWPVRNSPAYKIDPTTAGTHLVCADTGYPGSNMSILVQGCAQFVVQALSPTLTLSPNSGPVLSLATLTGHGFVPLVSYAIDIDGYELLNGTCGGSDGITTDGSGDFSLTPRMQLYMRYYACGGFSISYGRNVICANTSSSSVACTDFTLMSGLRPN